MLTLGRGLKYRFEVELQIWGDLRFFAFVKQKLKIKFGCEIQHSNFWTDFSCFRGTLRFVGHIFDSDVGNLAVGFSKELKLSFESEMALGFCKLKFNLNTYVRRSDIWL